MRKDQRIHNALLVLFPFVLAAFEAGFRAITDKPVFEFVGPSLSVAGLSFLVALTRVREYESAVEIDGQVQTVKKNDSEFVSAVLIALLIAIFFWLVSLYWSLVYPIRLGPVPAHVIVGIIIYVVSVVLTAKKGEA